jgi:Protein of unknown function (DUF2490)
MTRIGRWTAHIFVLQLMAVLGFAQAPQPSGGTDRSAWLSYFGDQPLTKLWAVHLEGSYRRTLGLSQFEQLELRPGITLNESRTQQSLFAYTFFRAQPTANGSFGPPPIVGKQIENRIFEQQQITHRLFDKRDSDPQLIHRFRLEQRWQDTAVDGKGYADKIFSQRVRYRLTAKIPLGRSGLPEHYFVAYNEVYVNATLKAMSLFNSDVTYGALGSRLGEHWAVEIGYQFRDSSAASGITGPQDHSLQVYLLSTAPFRHVRE